MLRSGRDELAELAGRAALGIADSRFNADELIEVGYRHTVVAPLLVDLARFDEAPDGRLEERLAADRDKRGGPDWLFVGRMVPNKAQHDLIGAFAAWRRLTGARSSAVPRRRFGAHWLRASAARPGPRPRRRRPGSLRRAGLPRRARGLLPRRRRVRVPVRARGLLRARARGDVPRAARGGLRRGGGARDRRRCRPAARRQAAARRGGRRGAHHPGPGATSDAGCGEAAGGPATSHWPARSRPSSTPWSLCWVPPVPRDRWWPDGPDAQGVDPPRRAAAASVRGFSQCRQGLRTPPDVEVVIHVASVQRSPMDDVSLTAPSSRPSTEARSSAPAAPIAIGGHGSWRAGSWWPWSAWAASCCGGR